MVGVVYLSLVACELVFAAGRHTGLHPTIDATTMITRRYRSPNSKVGRPLSYSPPLLAVVICNNCRICTGCSKKTDPLVYFDDNFGKYGPILTIFSPLQQEIYEAQKLSYFSHLTFIMLPLYLVKQTLMLVSM